LMARHAPHTSLRIPNSLEATEAAMKMKPVHLQILVLAPFAVFALIFLGVYIYTAREKAEREYYTEPASAVESSPN